MTIKSPWKPNSVTRRLSVTKQSLIGSRRSGLIQSTIDCNGPPSVSVWRDWANHLGEILAVRSFTWRQETCQEQPGRGWIKFLKTGQRHKWIFKSRISSIPTKQIELYTEDVHDALYVLLSAQWASLQKITALSTQEKPELQAGACKKCRTKSIYSAACMFLLITQHYCLFYLNSRCRESSAETKWGNRKITVETTVSARRQLV